MFPLGRDTQSQPPQMSEVIFDDRLDKCAPIGIRILKVEEVLLENGVKWILRLCGVLRRHAEREFGTTEVELERKSS
jgi:hypothetical protein